jgi:hypothetical protein
MIEKETSMLGLPGAADVSALFDDPDISGIDPLHGKRLEITNNSVQELREMK